jgi:superoxide oxidase
LSKNIDAAAVWPLDQVPRRTDRFDGVSIAFHWLTALLVAMQFATMLALLLAERQAEVLTMIHRSTGSALWVVVVARLIWRHSFAHLPAFPATMPKFQQRVAMLNEYALYFLLLLQPLTGFFDTLFRGRSFDLLMWQVPALLERNKAVYGLFHKLHELGAIALLVLIAVHATAALFHGLILRDGVFARMFPWTER